MISLWHADCNACTCTTTHHPQHSFARHSPRLACAIGRQIVAPPLGLPAAFVIHDQTKIRGAGRGIPSKLGKLGSRVSMPAREQGGARVRVAGDGHMQSLAFASFVDFLPLTGRGFGSGLFMHLRSKRAKSCDVSLFARLRGAYLDLCERQVSKLQHQIAVEKATNDDDDLRNMEADLAALAAKIEAKRAALK